jgi:hypothetical protein
VIAVIALAAGGTWLQHWHHNRAPYPASALHPRLDGLQVLTPSDASGTNIRDALHALGAEGKAASYPYPRGHDRQYVVGRLDLAAHKAPGDSVYSLVVIDNRTHTVVDEINGDPASGSAGNGAGGGLTGGMSNFAKKYPWLSMLADNAPGSGFDTAVVLSSGPAISLPFVAVLDRDALPVTNVRQDLTVALVMLGSDNQPYLATRLS